MLCEAFGVDGLGLGAAAAGKRHRHGGRRADKRDGKRGRNPQATLRRWARVGHAFRHDLGLSWPAKRRICARTRHSVRGRQNNKRITRTRISPGDPTGTLRGHQKNGRSSPPSTVGLSLSPQPALRAYERDGGRSRRDGEQDGDDQAELRRALWLRRTSFECARVAAHTIVRVIDARVVAHTLVRVIDTRVAGHTIVRVIDAHASRLSREVDASGVTHAAAFMACCIANSSLRYPPTRRRVLGEAEHATHLDERRRPVVFPREQHERLGRSADASTSRARRGPTSRVVAQAAQRAHEREDRGAGCASPART